MIELSFHYGWIQSALAFMAGGLLVGSFWAEVDADDGAAIVLRVLGLAAIMFAGLSGQIP